MDFFDYFQIGFLAVFYITFLGRTIQLYTSGIKPFVLGAGKKGIKAFIEITFFVGLIIWTFEIISHSLKLEYHIFHGALYYIFFSIFFLKVLGIAVIFVGYILFVWSLISFGESWRVGIDTQNPGNLIINGAFSFSRNPIFLFMDLYFLGTWLIYSNAFFLIFFIAVACGVHYQILQEEEFLCERYGNEFLSYTKKVPRYTYNHHCQAKLKK